MILRIKEKLIGALTLFCLLSFSQLSTADLIIIGNDPIDRSSADSWRNFVVSLDTEVFTIYGEVIDWTVHAANGGELALLILNNGEVVATDRRTVTAGLNTFDFVASTGNSLVEPGFNVGLWLGSAVVDFSRPGSGDELSDFDQVSWCANNGCASSAPGVGDVFDFNSGSWGNNIYRQYSVSVTDPPVQQDDFARVPVPGSLVLLGLGLLGFGFSQRRKRV